jgi:sugar (pentulose or hexulose) kinase
MWLLQECKRAWAAADKTITYDELAAAAAKSPPFVSLIDPDAADFQSPADMPGAITEFCRRTNQPAPENFGAFARAIFESLALKYRLLRESLARLTGWPVEKIHIVGGGSQNDLLNQFAADALNCPVVCGPVEATSMGNVIMQLCALGEMSSLAEGRAVIRRSVETKTFLPQNARAWDDAFARFQKILSH